MLTCCSCALSVFSESIFFTPCPKWLLAGEAHVCTLWGFSLQGFTDEQLALVQQNTLLVEEREREIRQIVQSISDLSEVFRDLGAMIIEQVRASSPSSSLGFPAVKSGPSTDFLDSVPGKKHHMSHLPAACVCLCTQARTSYIQILPSVSIKSTIRPLFR